MLGVSVEVGFEVGYGHAVGMFVVNAKTSAHVDVLYLNVVSFQLILQFIDAIASKSPMSSI